MQESYGKETAALIEKQHLELQQTTEAGSKQKEALADLEKRLDQLKLDHEQVISKHVQEKEALLKSSEDAKDAAVKVCHIWCLLAPETMFFVYAQVESALPIAGAPECNGYQSQTSAWGPF